MAGSRVAIWSGLRCNACSPISGPADRHRRHLQRRLADAVARQFCAAGRDLRRTRCRVRAGGAAAQHDKRDGTPHAHCSGCSAAGRAAARRSDARNPGILVEPPGKQRQGMAVPKLSSRAKPFVERSADNPVMVDQPQRTHRRQFPRADPSSRSPILRGWSRSSTHTMPRSCRCAAAQYDEQDGHLTLNRPYTIDIIAPIFHPAVRGGYSAYLEGNRVE